MTVANHDAFGVALQTTLVLGSSEDQQMNRVG
jgi:hypothetical protein